MFKRLFHHHDYEIIDRIESKYYSRNGDTLPADMDVTFVQRCKTCGKIKHYKIKF